MTIEETAMELVDRLELGNYGLWAIADAIREAVQAAYEDAAQLVERYNIVGSNINWADKQVAAAIRNRAKEVTQ